MTTKELYESNQDFKRYVDSYAKGYHQGKGIPVEEALNHLIVKRYAHYVEETANGKEAL